MSLILIKSIAEANVRSTTSANRTIYYLDFTNNIHYANNTIIVVIQQKYRNAKIAFLNSRRHNRMRL